MCESVKMLIGRGKRIRKKIKMEKNVKKLRKNLEKVKCLTYLCRRNRKEVR